MFWYSNSADHKWNGSLINSLPHCFSVISKLRDIVSADIAESFIHVSGVAYYGFLFPWKFCWVSSCRWESLFPNNLNPRYRSLLGRSVGNWGSINWNQLFKTKNIFFTVFQSKFFATLESCFALVSETADVARGSLGNFCTVFLLGRKTDTAVVEGLLCFPPPRWEQYLKNLQRFKNLISLPLAIQFLFVCCLILHLESELFSTSCWFPDLSTLWVKDWTVLRSL